MADGELFQTLPLFDAILNASERVIVNQGGTSSAKTYSILQVLFFLGMQNERQIITVVGQDIPNLKVGAFRDAKNIRNSSEVLKVLWPFVNEGDREIRCVNGSLMEFKSYDDAQDAKSGKRDYLFVNEANGIPYEIYWQLAMRTRKKVYIDYNPSERFWAHDKVIGTANTRLIISDHRRNFFLSEEEHARIENIADPELWKVYARGLTGKLEGVVFQNWDIVEALPPRDEWAGSWYGLDFGFTCFKGDTLIMTSEGERPIKDIKAGDYVLTRKGYYRVKRNIYNGYKKVLHKKFVKGLHNSDIFCTFEHNFNANGKWKKYGQLTKKDRLYVLPCSKAWSLGDTQAGSTETTITTSGRRMADTIQLCFTMPSMRMLSERSQRAWLSTIRISTRLIMTSAIWLCLQILSICVFIIKWANGGKNTQTNLESDGIRKRSGANEERRFLKTSKTSEGSASGAEKSSLQQTPISDFAESNVTTDGNIRLPKIIYRWYVSIVERLSRVINTLSQNVAAKNVRITYQSLSDIKDEGEEYCDVYDLWIDDVHEYFANGVLVHNCDPSALEHIVRAHGDLWIDEVLYETGLTNPMIAERARSVGMTDAHEIVADSAEPKSITELNGLGLWVTPSIKGADSIIVGIDILKRYRLHFTRRSVGIIDNARSYKWSHDKYGNQTNKPEDKNNHGIDAIRYVALKHLAVKRAAKGVRVRN